jgi:AcrR family transcriptional regulator
MARTGRRAGEPDTRDEILSAARAAFGRHGYDRATIRGIASDAGVDPALVHHYFGTKAELYSDAIAVPVDPRRLAAVIDAPDGETLGRRMATFFFRVWEDPVAREPLLGMLRGATSGNSAGADAFREYVSSALLPLIASALEGPERQLRVTMAMSHLVGIALLRYVIRIEPIASAPVEQLIEMVAPRMQSYLDAGDPDGDTARGPR